MHSTYTAEACGPPSSGPEFPASREGLANPDEFHHYSEPTAIAYFDGVTLNGGILCPPSPIGMPACLLSLPLSFSCPRCMFVSNGSTV